MRYNFIYHVLHLSISALLTVAMDADWTKGRQMRRPFDLNKVPPPEIEPEESHVGYFASSATSSSMHYRNSPYPILESTSILENASRLFRIRDLDQNGPEKEN
ncbi:hypothetical protein PCANC_09013 [Puccinia coronata f. sp. avenae]|uniref:Uncharacterized protein n=1 Tax=Puccinia coronata f. sp. avenae TaxID=200324 RepID=A0A2N5VHR8_9BASI|nr:hypothetical protein PCANC_09013 [Puccinia coronata f. sp. avenae]